MTDNEKELYTREILSAPEAPVINSIPQFGTFKGRFNKFSIKGLKRPFGNLPIPKFITNSRVHSSMTLSFCSPEIIGDIIFFSSQMYSFMELVYWQLDNNKKYAYRQLLPYGFIHLPNRLGYNITSCRTRRRYLRVLSRLSQGTLHADIDFLGSGDRPSCEARLDVDAKAKDFAEISAVIPRYVNKRCEASYTFTAPVSGWLSANYFKDLTLPKDLSVALFDYRKAYYGYRTQRLMVTGMGRIDGKIVSFQILSSIAPDSYNHNDNILFVDGKVTPLPPVKITMPYGKEKQWNIQDTEGMIDLIFTPKSIHNRHTAIFFLRANYDVIYGTFEGSLLTSDGTELKILNHLGFAKKRRFRF
ncbi:MAG: hypothetical protein CR988_05290 [Treponema sp.]|nr:MAG: hypothetical protein CR988_05290 [Treponema sp.]